MPVSPNLAADQALLSDARRPDSRAQYLLNGAPPTNG